MTPDYNVTGLKISPDTIVKTKERKKRQVEKAANEINSFKLFNDSTATLE